MSNVVNIDDIVTPVQIPDASAVTLLDNSPYAGVDVSHLPFRKFSMAAGNFVEIYGGADNKETWDCVVTCFFLDTAPVVMEYMETIHHCLKPGGHWINLGPLLYHWCVLPLLPLPCHWRCNAIFILMIKPCVMLM